MEKIQTKSGETALAASKIMKKLQNMEYGDVSESGRKVNCIFVVEGIEVSNIEFKRPNVSDTDIAIRNRKNVRLARCIQEELSTIGMEEPVVYMADVQDLLLHRACDLRTTLKQNSPFYEIPNVDAVEEELTICLFVHILEIQFSENHMCSEQEDVCHWRDISRVLCHDDVTPRIGELSSVAVQSNRQRVEGAVSRDRTSTQAHSRKFDLFFQLLGEKNPVELFSSEQAQWLGNSVNNGELISMYKFAKDFKYLCEEDADKAYVSLLTNTTTDSQAIRKALLDSYKVWKNNEGPEF
ncbi:hypothetical protein BGZ76_001801 [Entomortierella beljakovae]|nr:hypothetical protein BGZ76_001801 [Entomortierella beljakovae]